MDLSPLVKRSLAMMQADPLRTPPQAPPQPQYPASQMAQPSMVNPSMSQVGQPMHGAAPASNVVSELVLCMALKRSGLPLPVCSSIPDNYFSLLHRVAADALCVRQPSHFPFCLKIGQDARHGNVHRKR